MTLLLLGLERGTTRGTGRVRAALEVDEAGGASRGEEGPLRVEGRRVRAEPPLGQATAPAAAPSERDPERRRPPDWCAGDPSLLNEFADTPLAV